MPHILERKSRLAEIIAQPTVINNVHESVYRVSQVLNYVEHLLRKGAPPAVVLDFIEDMSYVPQTELTLRGEARMGMELQPLIEAAEEEVARKKK